MRPTNDARYLINKKRQKKPSNIVRTAPRGIVDARSILNSKLGQKSRLTTRTASGVFPQRKQFFSRKKPVQSSSRGAAVEKRVQVARDGNIVITAKPKNTVVERRPPISRWTPSDIETTSVEHLGIDDVLDMDVLPSAPLPRAPVIPRVGSSLADEIAEMQNTMIADQLSSPSHQPVSVLVTNLHVSVSKQDIIELFGDIGVIKHVEIPQRGMAVVEYYDANDAVRACELYHQRLLDGQPMMCQVQSNPPKRSLVSQRLGGKVHPPGFPSSSAISSRSIHNPRNVRFTVKLT